MASHTLGMSDNVAEIAPPMRQRVAEEVRVLLARRRMSASELARRMGQTQPYVWRRLTGEVALDVDDLDQIAQVLDVQPAALLGTPVTVRYPAKPQKRSSTRPPDGRPATLARRPKYARDYRAA